MSTKIARLLVSLENVTEQKERPVAHITITGPVGCGKSAVMDKIIKMLKAEFPGIEMEITDPEEYDELEDWQREMILKTKWITHELSTSADEETKNELLSEVVS